MALRVARGLFRLWLVLSVLWIGAVGIVTWKRFPVDDWRISDPPAKAGSSVPLSTIEICSTAKNDEQCFDMLAAAGRNPFDAYDLNWDDLSSRSTEDLIRAHRRLIDKDRREAIQFASLVAIVPPAFVLALGSALVWAFKGFR
jgi:hypothetical protein